MCICRRNYLLRHTDVREIGMRTALYRYVSGISEAREYAAVEYLKKLDEWHEERDASVAADEVSARCFGKHT
jgi:hypothetical protein